MTTLTQVEWIQIALSVDDKLAALRSGFYGRDRTTRDWIAHLEDIRDEIGPKVAQQGVFPKDFSPQLTDEDWRELYYCIHDEELQEKIGPDGENMTHPDTDEHRAACVSCMYEHDKRLPDA